MHGALSLAFLAVLLVAPARAQTLDEVRKAVDDYFADDAAAQASRSALKRWGNDALPFLRELAGKPEDVGIVEHLMPVRVGEWDLVCSIDTVDTPEAIEFLIEILDGKTSVPPPEALSSLMTATHKHGDQLRDHLRFQQLVFKFAKDGSGVLSKITRTEAADIIADLGWEDGEPLLELMLQDPDLDVRQDAAEALQKLTGRVVDVDKPELSFPHAAPSTELELVTEFPNNDARGRLDTWFDGKPALIVGMGRRLTAIREPGTPNLHADFEGRIGDILSLPGADGSMRWVLLVAGEREIPSNQDVAVCLDWEQHELWRFAPRREGIKSLCRLYDTTGCAGIAFGAGGKEGVAAFASDGRELFQVPFLYVTYELSSNPGVPDRWVHCGGRLAVYDNAGRVVGGSQPGRFGQPSGGFFYASHVVLAHDGGEPVLVAAGQDFRSTPTIVCCDADLNEVWRAGVPDEITALALLEPTAGEPRVVATTDGGQLLLFDLDGGLRQQLDLPRDTRSLSSARRSIPVESMSAGSLPGGGYGLAVGFLASTAIYSLR